MNEAADFLGIAKSILYGKSCKQLIPHFKKGKKLYFHKPELIDRLKSGKRKTASQIHEDVNILLGKRKVS